MFLDLRTQAVDVGVYGVLVIGVAVAPDQVEQLGAGVDAAGVAGELLEQVELLGREVDGPAAEGHRAFLRVQSQLAGADNPGVGRVAGEVVDPADDGLHPGA